MLKNLDVQHANLPYELLDPLPPSLMGAPHAHTNTTPYFCWFADQSACLLQPMWSGKLQPVKNCESVND